MPDLTENRSYIWIFSALCHAYNCVTKRKKTGWTVQKKGLYLLKLNIFWFIGIAIFVSLMFKGFFLCKSSKVLFNWKKIV